MAIYTETIYANDSYQTDINTGKITRSSTLATTAQYQFYGDNYGVPNSGSIITISFPAGTYGKKRMITQQLYCYVTSKSTSGSGNLPSGESFIYFLSESDRNDFYTYGDYSAGPAISGFTANKYNYINDHVNFSPWDWPNDCNAKFTACAGVTGNIYTNRSYNITAELKIQSHTGANKPYKIVTYEDVKPYPANPFPSSGFVNEKSENLFGWDFAYDPWDITGELNQSAYIFRWREKGAASYTETRVNSTETRHTVPAHTFTGNAVEWQVALISDDNVQGDFSDWYELSTIDDNPTTELVYPVSVVVDGSKPITFRWDHVISTGSPQSKYDLQISYDNGVEWSTISAESTDRQSYTAESNSMNAGTVLWRVRTYNSDGVSGNWSTPATISVRAAPVSPSIYSVDNKPRPTITWQSNGQQAFEIIAGRYSSGIIYGNHKFFKIPVYLQDGQTEIKLRIQNSYGLWSPWAIGGTTISNISPGSITLSTRMIKNSVMLSWLDSGDYQKYYIYRDGNLIAKTEERQYSDPFSIGKAKYEVQGVDDNDYYTISNPALEIVRIKNAVISAADNINWISLEYGKGKRPTHQITTNADVSYHHYLGRKLPVADVSPSITRTHQFNFAFRSKSRDDYARIMDLVGQRVIYKDCYNDMAIGILESQDASCSIDAEITLTVVDTDEGVAQYDE